MRNSSADGAESADLNKRDPSAVARAGSPSSCTPGAAGAVRISSADVSVRMGGAVRVSSADVSVRMGGTVSKSESESEVVWGCVINASGDPVGIPSWSSMLSCMSSSL